MADARRTLYICYLSLEDPLVQTQVVAYLEGLSRRGHVVHLLTFDGPLSRLRRREISAELSSRGIAWHSLRYHKRPSLPATIFDSLLGAVVAAWLTRRHGLDVIHARNHIPAVMAMIARRISRCRFIFDVRGLMAEEYVDAGLWQRGGIPYRLTAWTQERALRQADGVVMLTEAVRQYLPAPGGPRVVIPCCADVERIAALSAEREQARAELGVGGRTVIVYTGKFTGWYMEAEMADFFAVLRRYQPDLVVLVITQADPSPMLRELKRVRAAPDDHRVIRAAPTQIGRYLAAADLGISFIRPCPSKISSSPTKVGEYLSAGLPVVANTGVGDLETIIARSRTGILVDDFSEASYERAAAGLSRLREDPRLSERCRAIAREQFSLREVGIPRYDWLYRNLGDPAATPPAFGGQAPRARAIAS